MQDKPMCGAANKYFLKGEIYLETCKEKKLLKAVLYNSAWHKKNSRNIKGSSSIDKRDR